MNIWLDLIIKPPQPLEIKGEKGRCATCVRCGRKKSCRESRKLFTGVIKERICYNCEPRMRGKLK